MIKRDKYLKLLISASNNGFPKVITGIRRCGKSYLLLANFFLFDKNIEFYKKGDYNICVVQ